MDLSMRRLANAGVGVFGFELQKKTPQLSGGGIHLPDTLHADNIVDIGVAKGTPWLYRSFPNSKLFLIDPFEDSQKYREQVRGREYEFIQCAVGATRGQVTINRNLDAPSLTSVLQRTPLTAKDHRYESVVVEMETLDHLFADRLGRTESFGIKIDTEGYELEVLKGASRLLQRTNFVICEASVEKRFYESYDFTELVGFMAERGFRVSKVLTADRDRNGVIRFVDLLFERLAA